MLDEAVEIVSEAEPVQFCEMLLPWLEAALRATGGISGGDRYYGYDDLSHGWEDDVYAVRNGMIRAFVSALTAFARRDLLGFRRAASRLAAIPSLTPQRILANVYAEEPELLASDALAFLLADRRRLDLGECDQYESRRLVGAIFPSLLGEDRARLEGFILDNPRPRRGQGVRGLQRRGLDQLYLLQAIPRDHLSDRGRGYLDELERKFPGMKASDDQRTMVITYMRSPISAEATTRMSDRDWLRAMRKYRPGISHRDPSRGGYRHLGCALLTEVKGAPERFYRLVGRVPDAVVEPYAWAFINGIAESSAPSEWLFDLTRRFANLPDPDGRRVIASALKKRVELGLPDDLVDMLEGWVRDVGLDGTREVEGDPYAGYLNSDRGAALGTLMRALDQRASSDALDRRWRLIEFIATDPSTTLRAGAVEELLHYLQEDRERAVGLFERRMIGHSTLVRSPATQKFLYYGLYRHFARSSPYIQALMDEPAEEHAQRGSEIACIAAISPLAMESPEAHALAVRLAAGAIAGPRPWRRGAARVFAANLHRGSSEECVRALSRLLDDEDAGVRHQVGELIRNLRGADLIGRRDLLIVLLWQIRCSQINHHSHTGHRDVESNSVHAPGGVAACS